VEGQELTIPEPSQVTLSPDESHPKENRYDPLISERYSETRYNQFNDLLWSDREIQRLLNSYLECSKEQLIELFPDRTWIAIKTKAKQIGIYKTPRWTAAEIQKIEKLGPTMESIEDLTRHFPGRSLKAVENKFYELDMNLKKKAAPLSGSVQESCTIYIEHILNEINKMQHSCTTYSEKGTELTRDMVQDVCTLISVKRWPVTRYFLVYGAATAWTLRFRLSAKRRTVYEALEQLRMTGLITDYHRAQIPARNRKKPTTVWGLQSATTDQVREAQLLHIRLCSPKYRTADTLSQTILEQWMVKGLQEIHAYEIMQEVKALKLPFNGQDIADMTAQLLQEKGMTVWRNN